MLFRFSALLLSFFLVLLCAPPVVAAPPLPVLVSIAPQKYMLERIAENAVSVTVLVKPGSDPHAYEPGPAQMRAAEKAAVWFTIGVPFEDVWLPKITGASKELRVVSCIKGMTRLSFADEGRILADLRLALGVDESNDSPDQGHGHAHDQHTGEDPHVWLSPILVRQMLPILAEELAGLSPEHAVVFRNNAEAFAKELEALDAELAARFNEFSRNTRVFLTFHPSWRYFAHNYQLTELSIEIDGKEPGPRSLKAVTDLAKRLGIRTVFVEPQFPKGAAEAVATAIGADLVVADPLAENLPALFRGMTEKLIDSFKHLPAQH